MKYIEVSQNKYRNFILNSDLNIYGVSNGIVEVTYIKPNDCLAFRFQKGNQKCYIREDYIYLCE
jgi:hypothetical protein